MRFDIIALMLLGTAAVGEAAVAAANGCKGDDLQCGVRFYSAAYLPHRKTANTLVT